MTKVDKDLSASKLIDDYIEDHNGWRGEMLVKLRKVFHEADSEIVEGWKWMGSPVYSHDGIIAVTNAHKKKVKITFNQGANFEDEHGLFNAGLGGKKWRAIDLFEDDDIDESKLKDLIQNAVNYNISKSK